MCAGTSPTGVDLGYTISSSRKKIISLQTMRVHNYYLRSTTVINYVDNNSCRPPIVLRKKCNTRSRSTHEGFINRRHEKRSRPRPKTKSSVLSRATCRPRHLRESAGSNKKDHFSVPGKGNMVQYIISFCNIS